jgi:hypothetical protein
MIAPCLDTVLVLLPFFIVHHTQMLEPKTQVETAFDFEDSENEEVNRDGIRERIDNICQGPRPLLLATSQDSHTSEQTRSPLSHNS